MPEDEIAKLLRELTSMIKAREPPPVVKPKVKPVPVKHKAKDPRRADFALLLFPSKRYKLGILPDPRGFEYDGIKYPLESIKHRRLENWRPLKKEWFLSDILVRDGIYRAMTIIGEDGKPLDRLDQPLTDTLTPHIHRAWMITPVIRDRYRKMRIGGVDLRIVAVAVGITVLILVLLYFSGYFG